MGKGGNQLGEGNVANFFKKSWGKAKHGKTDLPDFENKSGRK